MLVNVYEDGVFRGYQDFPGSVVDEVMRMADIGLIDLFDEPEGMESLISEDEEGDYDE